jgi:hypothetical protein
MNNRRTEKLAFTLISKMEATSPEAINCIQPQRIRRLIDKVAVENHLLGNLLTASPYLVSVTRWVE